MAMRERTTTDITALHNENHVVSASRLVPTNTDTAPPFLRQNPAAFVAGLIPLWLYRSHPPQGPDATGMFAPSRVGVASRAGSSSHDFDSGGVAIGPAEHVEDAFACGHEWPQIGSFEPFSRAHVFQPDPRPQEITADRQGDYIDSFAFGTARSKISLRPAWRPQIEAANSNSEIFAVLRLFGLNAIANRLRLLRDLAEEDPEERFIEIESLRSMALFVMGERQFRDPQIGVTPDGLAHVEWRFGANGILAMQFLSSGLIRFAAVSAPINSSAPRPNVSGTLPTEETLAAVKSFTWQL